MSRRRKYGEDLTYSEEHRRHLPMLYRRIGHRLDMADRDWTEYCHHCKDPLALVETVRDVGQDLNDKAVTVTRRTAERARLPALLLAWRVERPADVQNRIDALNGQIRQLAAAYPIVEFKCRPLWRPRQQFLAYAPDEWWLEVLHLHRSHHRDCSKAQRWEVPVNNGRLERSLEESRLWTPWDGQLRLQREWDAA